MPGQNLTAAQISYEIIVAIELSGELDFLQLDKKKWKPCLNELYSILEENKELQNENFSTLKYFYFKPINHNPRYCNNNRAYGLTDFDIRKELKKNLRGLILKKIEIDTNNLKNKSAELHEELRLQKKILEEINSDIRISENIKNRIQNEKSTLFSTINELNSKINANNNYLIHLDENIRLIELGPQEAEHIMNNRMKHYNRYDQRDYCTTNKDALIQRKNELNLDIYLNEQKLKKIFNSESEDYIKQYITYGNSRINSDQNILKTSLANKNINKIKKELNEILELNLSKLTELGFSPKCEPNQSVDLSNQNDISNLNEIH